MPGRHVGTSRKRDYLTTGDLEKLAPTRTKIGALIREARIRRGISTSELARRTPSLMEGKPSDARSLRALESGHRNPSYNSLQRIADGLDMDLIVEFREKE